MCIKGEKILINMLINSGQGRLYNVLFATNLSNIDVSHQQQLCNCQIALIIVFEICEKYGNCLVTATLNMQKSVFMLQCLFSEQKTKISNDLISSSLQRKTMYNAMGQLVLLVKKCLIQVSHIWCYNFIVFCQVQYPRNFVSNFQT